MPLRPILEGVVWDTLCSKQRSKLERPFSVDNVIIAIDNMEEDKAPDPDGFPSKFLKTCWDVVGGEVMEVSDAFQSNDQWCKSLSATFVTLIPKKKRCL